MTDAERPSPFDACPVVIGHRGAAGLSPENTLASFRLAAGLGVQAVELDVHRCQDELVVIHDPTLERTTNGHGAVAETTLPALRALDAGGGQRIPTLAEVFAALPAGVGINVELKGEGTAPLLARWLPADPERAVLVSSFDHQALRAFRDLRGDCPVAPVFHRWRGNAVAVARDLGAAYLNLGRKLVDAARMAEIREAGLRCLVYTVNDLREARKFVRLGVWGLFTDYPDRINREALLDEEHTA